MTTLSGSAPWLNGQGQLTATATQRIKAPATALSGSGTLTAGYFHFKAAAAGFIKPPIAPIGHLTQATPVFTGGGYEVQVRAAPDYHTLLCVVPRFLSLQFTKQLKDKGSGTIAVDMDDSAFWNQTLGNGAAASTLLDNEHLWQVYQDGVLRFEFFAETVTEQYADESEQRIATITGPGTAAALNWAAAMPPGFPNIVFKTDGMQDGFAEIDVSGKLTLDTNIWNLVSPSSHVTLNPSGTLQLTGSPGTTYCGSFPWDITTSSISAQVTPIVDNGTLQNLPAQLNGSQVSQMYVQDPANAGNYALIGLSGSLFYCQVGTGGGHNTHQLKTYDPSSHTYWRISENKGTFSFWTSADGQNWVKQWFCVYGWNATKVDVYFAARYSIDSSQIMQVTNLNGDIITPSSAGNVYFGEPIMGVWFDLFTRAQARGTIPMFYTRLNGNHDSFGHVWNDSVSVQVQNGTGLFDLLTSHTSIVNADWVVNPGFELVVGLPTTDGITLGTDKSSTIILREGFNELTKQRIRARDKLANLIAGVNSDGTVVTAQDAASIQTWGQREGWIQTATQVNPESMAGAAKASITETKDEILSWTMTIPADMTGIIPFRDFDVGDWVGAERPSGGSIIDVVRVVALAISIDATGLVTCEPTLVTYRQWVQEQLDYLVNKLGGSFINSLGTTPVTSSALSPQNLPTLTAPSLGGLTDVVTGTVNMDPLVYNATTGIWQPASVVSTITGQPLGVTIGVVGGSSMTLAPSASGVTILVTDTTGATRTIVGTQPDGSVTHADYNAAPPLAPSDPLVDPGILGMYVGWDGLMFDGSLPLADLGSVEVHVSINSGFTPDSSSLQGHVGAGGILGVGKLTAGTTYYARLLAINTSGIAGAPSDQISAVPTSVPQNIPAGSVTGVMVKSGTLDASHLASNAGIVATQLAANAGITSGQVIFQASDIGGLTVSIQPTPPASPALNALWYDSSNGYALKQWNGSSWAVYQWGAGALATGSVTANQIVAGCITASQIAAGTILGTNIAGATITGDLIAAGTIDAEMLVAGLVIAGVVDGTVIEGATLIADGTTGQILVYNGTPGDGNLIFSVSASQGTDAFGNPYPAGLGLTQGSMTGVTLLSSILSQPSISGGSAGGLALSGPSVTGGTITETTITFDTTGGVLLLYATTTTTITQSTAGIYSWLVPAGISTAKIGCWGAGAGGGGGFGGGTQPAYGGYGGGGGGCSIEPQYPVSAGSTVYYLVGAGGTGSTTGGGTGADGGDTVFNGNGVRAYGGTGNNAGGQASGNSISFPGGSGQGNGAGGGAGGGSSAGTASAGHDGALSVSTTGAAGGSAPTGGGNGGNGGNQTANGNGGSSPGGGGGGAGWNSGATTTKTYNSTSTDSYYGQDVGGGKRNVNGSMYQGAAGTSPGVSPGNQFSFFHLPYSTIQSDMSGKTIAKAQLTVDNLHTWYTGMYAQVGYSRRTSWPSSIGTFTTDDHPQLASFFIDEGVTLTRDVTSAMGSSLATIAGAVMFGPSTAATDFWRYGYFAGYGGGPLTLKLSYGTGSFQTAGKGADGQVQITYTNGVTLIGAVAATSGTDSGGNTYQQGVSAVQSGIDWASLAPSGTHAALLFGAAGGAADTNLYRSSANTLATDDNFVIGGIGQVLATEVAVSESRASTTSLTADSYLTSVVTAGATYAVDMLLIYSGPLSTFFKWSFTLPSGFMNYNPVYIGAGNNGTLCEFHTGSDAPWAYTDGTGTRHAFSIRGALAVSSPGGTFSFNWAQQTSNSGNLTLYNPSWMKLQRIA